MGASLWGVRGARLGVQGACCLGGAGLRSQWPTLRSLWFPGFREFVFSREPLRRPDRLYFSVGDKESKTRNPVLQTVQENTEALCGFYRGKGVCATFQLNPGGHHEHPAQRTAAGIQWLAKE